MCKYEKLIGNTYITPLKKKGRIVSCNMPKISGKEDRTQTLKSNVCILCNYENGRLTICESAIT